MTKKAKKNQEIIDQITGPLSVEDAVKVLWSLDHANFKEGTTIELHFNLNIDPTKSDQLIRTTLSLPNGTGKKVLVAAFVSPEKESEAKEAGAEIIGGDELIDKIKATGKVEFDAAVAEPVMMKNLAKIARILGTQGVMPSPKNGSVSIDVGSAIKEIKAGKLEVKNDKTGNLHIVVGKINKSFDEAKVSKNVSFAIDAIKKSKPEGVKKNLINSITICSTMSPSIRVAF